MRGVGSSHADPYVSVAAAAAALYGPLHGGAKEQVLRMLGVIGPSRMAYDRVIPVVQAAAEALGAAIQPDPAS